MRKVCHISSAHSITDVRIFNKELLSLSKKYDTFLVIPNTLLKEKEGVHIMSFNVGKMGRLFRMLKVTRSVYKKALSINADVYHIHDPELLPYALKLKRKGKKVIYDAHEDIEAQILNKDYIPLFFRKILSVLVKCYLYHSLKRFDGVITVSPHIIDKFKTVREDITLVTNYPICNGERILNDYTQRIICFPGLISYDWMHENILRALEKIKDVKYLLAGTPEPGVIETLKKMPSWSTVEYLGKIPHSEVIHMFERATIGIALFDYTPNAGYKKGTLGNTKIFEYMRNAIPVICTDFILWKEIIDKWECGICVNPHNIDAIYKAIEYLLFNPDVAKKMGENGRKAIEAEYNWEKQELNLLGLYEKILG